MKGFMLPKSKVLSVSKGMMCNAKFAYGSPKQSQHVTVNISPNSASSEISDTSEYQPVRVSYGDDNPYANLTLPATIEEYRCTLEHRDRLVQASNVIIDIIKSNPLIMKKFIIAKYESLGELIRLLTNADHVEFNEKEIDIGCCSSIGDLFYIDTIRVRVKDKTYYLKQKFPDVIQMLEDHKISHKIVIC
jgi:hypothetical protein